MKTETLVIETPEKIQFTYTIAEIGTRIAAYFIDFLIQAAILLFLLLLAGLTLFGFNDFGEDRTLYYLAVIYIMLFLLQWGYFILFESLMNGQTPGKKICRIRVIKAGGEPLDIPCLVIRNLLRAADSLPLPFFNFLGGLITIIEHKNRRLGDLAAGTVVVADSVFNLKEPDFFVPPFRRGEKLLPPPLEKDRLSERDLFIIRQLLKGKDNMPGERALNMAEGIIKQLEKSFDLTDLDKKEPFLIIEEIYRVHCNENQE